MMESTTLFEDFDLPAPLLASIQALGFERCTPIQAQALPHALGGRDIIGRAQTGTGKTAAFLIAILNAKLRDNSNERGEGAPKAVVIAPVRELAQQIARDAEDLSRGFDFNIVNLIGGVPYDPQRKQMSQPVDLVVATPGRLLDFHSQRHISLRGVRYAVIDEADRMLDMGFIRSVSSIIGAMPSKGKRQTMMFSATVDARVRRLASAWLNDPVMVDIEPEHVASENVVQKIYLVSTEQKYPLLRNILRDTDVSSALIFVNRRDTAQRLHKSISGEGLKVGLMSGAVRQEQRDKTLQKFRDGSLKALVATDVAGRGLHIEGVSHVVNYDLPMDPEDYVHRIGRTGRAGASGYSISLACEDGVFNLQAIESLLKRRLDYETPPTELLAP